MNYNTNNVKIQKKVKNGVRGMEYLNHVLGIQVIYKGDTLNTLPNFINARYRVQKVTLDGRPAIFVYPKEELDAVSAIEQLRHNQ